MPIQFQREERIGLLRHCADSLPDFGASKPEEIDINSMTWSELGRAAKVAVTRANALAKSITNDMPEREAESIEHAFDALMEIHDKIQDEKDTRTMLDDRSPRASNDDYVDISRRPIQSDKVARTDDGDSHSRAFEDWLRNPRSDHLKNQLSQIEARASDGLTGAAGGFIVPEQIYTPIMSRARDANPFRRLARVVRVSSGDVKFPLSEGDAASGWVGETDTRSATTEPTLASKTPTFGTNYAFVSCTEELLQDGAVSILDWFESEASRAMAESEMAAIITGNGTAKPTGFLNTAPEAAADGSRTADALKYIPSGAASDLGSTVFDILSQTVYDLKASYRSNAAWVMNSATANVIRTEKYGDGHYIWSESMAEGQPPRLLGYPVVFAESMPDIGTNAHPIAFGDWSRGYVLAERGGLRVTVDDNITTPGYAKFYIRYRIGGCTYDENSVRVVKCAAS